MVSPAKKEVSGLFGKGLLRWANCHKEKDCSLSGGKKKEVGKGQRGRGFRKTKVGSLVGKTGLTPTRRSDRRTGERKKRLEL